VALFCTIEYYSKTLLSIIIRYSVVNLMFQKIYW